MPKMLHSRAQRGPASHSLPYTFLHISSGIPRKGIEELVTSYCLAFSRQDPVLLVIKTARSDTNLIDYWLSRLTDNFDYSPAIQVIYEDVNQDQLNFLYEVSDVVVLPTRGEGFNLPAAEGLARGLPLIVTRHGGHLDFCTDENSTLLDNVYEFSGNEYKFVGGKLVELPTAYWARPSVKQLVEAMKTAFSGGRCSSNIMATRASKGRQDTLQLRWSNVATQIERFAEHLSQRPLEKRKLRLAWVSTYNTKCGIAAYSAHLLEFFDKAAFDITIIADDGLPIGPDPENIVRLWNGHGGELTRALDYIIRNNFDAIVVQYNSEFYDFRDFADTLFALAEENIQTFVMFHRTKDLENRDRLVSLERMVGALQTCARLFLHSLEDANRFRQWGLVENIVHLPHGVIEKTELNAEGVRSLLALSGFYPVIGTFGFLLPGKGLPELIQGFSLLLNAFPTAHLLMINANYPSAESEAERERCLALAKLLGVDDRVRLINEFLQTEEITFLLSGCHLIVYPYQWSEESASGAVRLGLATGRPVLTTPLPVFSDLSEIVYQLKGNSALDIADGVISCLRDEARVATIVQRQQAWIRSNSWAAQAARLANIIIGCVEEAERIDLGVCSQVELAISSDLMPAATTGSAGDRPHIEVASTPLGKVAAGAGGLAGSAAESGYADSVDASPMLPPSARAKPQPRKHGSRLWRHLHLKGMPIDEAKEAAVKKALNRADRARDARDWVAATRYYDAALALQPDDAAAWVQYGHSLKESGNLSAAEQAYRKSLELSAGVGDTYLQLGHVLKIQGRKIEARFAYLRALALDPALDDASVELKALGWRKGRIQLALRRERPSGS